MSPIRVLRNLIATVLIVAAALLLVSAPATADGKDPWTKNQTVLPADLMKEMGNQKTAPTVVFVGFKRLYGAGHIKGAQYHGTTGTEEGIKEFKSWATTQAKNANIVIYCGCCPMEKCPNIRPAFKALQEMGFTKVRVLLLPTDFASDWADKGLPYDKGN